MPKKKSSKRREKKSRSESGTMQGAAIVVVVLAAAVYRGPIVTWWEQRGSSARPVTADGGKKTAKKGAVWNSRPGAHTGAAHDPDVELFRTEETVEWFVDEEKRRCSMIRGAKHCMPGLIVAGAKKAGSSLLSTYLEQHPNVHHAVQKELHYFGHTPKNETEYLLKFKPSEPGQVNSETTPRYMAQETAMQDIAEQTDAKVVVSLRHPTDRAYSEYWMLYQIMEEAEKSIVWLEQNLLAITICLGAVYDLNPPIPPLLQESEKFLGFIHAAMQPVPPNGGSFKSDKCLMFFPKHEISWNHIIHVRDLFRLYGPEIYRCLTTMKDLKKCSLGINEAPLFVPDPSQPYTSESLYAGQVAEVLRTHPDALIIFYEDLTAKPVETLSKIFEFVGLPPYEVTARNHEETRQDLAEFFPDFVLQSGWTFKKKPKLTQEQRDIWDAYFKEPDAELRKLIGDLPAHWP